MLRFSSGSCMLRLGLRLRIRSSMLRLGLRLSFRRSGWPPLPLKLSLSLRLSMHDPMLSLSSSLIVHHPMLTLSMLNLDPNHGMLIFDIRHSTSTLRRHHTDQS